MQGMHLPPLPYVSVKSEAFWRISYCCTCFYASCSQEKPACCQIFLGKYTILSMPVPVFDPVSKYTLWGREQKQHGLMVYWYGLERNAR